MHLEFVKQAGSVVCLGGAQFGSSRNYGWSDESPFRFENWKNSKHLILST